MISQGQNFKIFTEIGSFSRDYDDRSHVPEMWCLQRKTSTTPNFCLQHFYGLFGLCFYLTSNVLSWGKRIDITSVEKSGGRRNLNSTEI